MSEKKKPAAKKIAKKPAKQAESKTTGKTIAAPARRILIAITQDVTWPGDVDRNIKSMAPLVDQAGAAGARVVVFSECSITGYDHSLVGVKAAISADDPRLDLITGMARRSGAAVLAGLYEKAPDGIYNSAIVFFPDGRRIVQRKHNIIAWENDKTDVRAGPRKREVFEIAGQRFAILICADSGIPKIHDELAAQKVDCILAPTAGMGDSHHAFHQAELKKPARLKKYLEAAQSVCFINPLQMLTHHFALACCNQMGYDESIKYFQPGHAAVMDRTGECTALLPGRFIVEHHRPTLAIGSIAAR
jgi:predicted amidohydrolase